MSVTEFTWDAPSGPLPEIPDDMTCAQFMLDYAHVTRPASKPGRPWVIEDATGRTMDKEEIRTRVQGLANALASRWKIVEDDVVALYSPNHIDYPMTVWAVHRLGAILTAANPSYTADELSYQLTTTKAKVLIVHPVNYAVGKEAARQSGISEDRIILLEPVKGANEPTYDQLVRDGLNAPPAFEERRLHKGEARTKLAFLSFSSGTTGRPKAVCIPHYAPIANIIQMSHLANQKPPPGLREPWRPGDVALAVLPFFHIYGLVVVMHFSIFYEMSLVVVPKFSFVDMLKSVQRHRINFMPLVPPMVVLLCKHPAVKDFDLSSIYAVMSGAAPLTAELTKVLAELLPQARIGQGYGMTETCTTVTFPQHDQKIGTLGSAGRILPGTSLRILRQDGSLASYDEPGELLVKGPSMALRYMNNEQATTDTFRDGWVHTGDEALVKESGEVYILDRIKELIKVKGFQVAPAELEGHLLNHPDVSDVCVVSIPDDYSGELPLAYVVPTAPAAARLQAGPQEVERTKASIMKYVADSKVDYKRLTGGVQFIEAVPKNPSGKLLRRVLRDRARELHKQGKLVLPKRERAKL